MAFCKECGRKLGKGPFCSSCGAKTGEKKTEAKAEIAASAGKPKTVAAGISTIAGIPNFGQTAAATVAGVLILLSLTLPWACALGQCVSALDAASATGKVGISLLGTFSNILMLLGVLVLAGGVLHFLRIKAAGLLCNAGGWLTLILSGFCVFLLSTIPGVSLGIGLWLCLAGGIIAIIAPYVQRE